MVQLMVLTFCAVKRTSQQIERATDAEMPYWVLAVDQPLTLNTRAAFRQQHLAVLAGQRFARTLQLTLPPGADRIRDKLPKTCRTTTRELGGSRCPMIETSGSPGGGSGRPGARLVRRRPLVS